MSLSRLATHRPVATAVAFALFQFLLTMAILLAGKALAPAQAFGAIKLVAFGSTILFPVLLVQALGLWRQVGLEPARTRPAPVFLACLLLVPLYLSIGIRTPSAAGLASDLVIQFFNAFGEELLFRGVIFVLLLRLPVLQAIVLNGVLFGSMHLLHGFMGAGWESAAWQAVFTSLGGMMFMAVRLRTGSLWLAIALHMAKNLAVMYSDASAAGPATMPVLQGITVLVEVAVTAYAVLAARREARPASARRPIAT